MARGNCRCCGNEYSINADGTVRYHITDKPECRDPEDADSRKCNGVGQRPEGAVELPETGTGYVCRVPAGPEGCGRPVRLHDSGRARSHLNNAGHRCGGGSDWPVEVLSDGTRRDTAPADDDEPEPVRQLRLAGALDLPHDRGADPHAREADIAIAEAERIQREQDADCATALRDGLAESRARVAGAGPASDSFPIGAEHDPDTGVPAGVQADAFIRELKGAVGDPGTVARQLEAYQGVLDPVECACNLRWRTVEAMNAAGHNDMDCDEAPMLHPEAPQPGAGELFDVTHRFTDPSGVEWIHPGEAVRCVLPDCCTHPQGFTYGDDGNGHSGSFCHVCGAPEPEPGGPCGIIEPDDPNACGQCVDCNPAEAWRTPAHLILDMPEGIRRINDTNPECWDCGHEVTPRAERFGPDSRITHVVWECSSGRTCRCALSGPCRPQLPEEDRLGNVDEGDCFMRHLAKPPLNRLVYRVAEHESAGTRLVTVVGAGPYAGQTGQLTNMMEEVTCVNQDGHPRPRRTPEPTPSAPDPAMPVAGTGRSSTPGTSRTAKPSAAPREAASGKATSSGRTARAVTFTAGAPMTDAFSTPKQTVSESDKYDRFGRYKLRHPSDPKKKVAWTRATTFAKSVQDTFALSQWAQRMTLKGAALSPDIVAAAGTLDVREDRNQLNSLVEDAKKAAGVKVAANLGTAVHTYTERRDRGEDQEIPEEHIPTVDAYTQVLADFGLEPVPGLIEFTTAVIQFEIAGTSDRCYRVTRDITIDLNGRPVTLYAGEYVIGDVKTGADLTYGWQEIAIQLSIYAQGLNTSGVWDWSKGVWLRPTDPDQPDVQIQVRMDVGIVPHLPVDRERTGAPLATLYAIDLTAGWAACVLCNQVRDWRKESKLAVPLTVADLTPPPAPGRRAAAAGAGLRSAPAAVSGPPEAPAKADVTGRPPTLRERAQAVRNRGEASAVFQAATTAKVTRKELDDLVAVMKHKLESHVEQGA